MHEKALLDDLMAKILGVADAEGGARVTRITRVARARSRISRPSTSASTSTMPPAAPWPRAQTSTRRSTTTSPTRGRRASCSRASSSLVRRLTTFDPISQRCETPHVCDHARLAVVAQMWMPAPGRRDHTAILVAQAVPELEEHVLRPGVGGAEAAVGPQSVPSAAAALEGGIEPEEHPVAPRARLAVQNRGTAHHELPPRWCRDPIQCRPRRSRTESESSTDRACRVLRSPGQHRVDSRRACDRDRRCAVGRRGQGEDRRPARTGLGPRLPLSGWAERRAHDRGRRRDVQDPADSVRHRRRQGIGDRGGLRGRSTRRDRRARRPRGPRPRHRGPGLPLRQRPSDHAVARRSRRRPRAQARQSPDRDDAPGDRAGVCRQGDADRDPSPGPARSEDPASEDRARDHREERVARPRLRDRAVRSGRGGAYLRGLRAAAAPVRRRHVAARRSCVAKRRQRAVRGRAGNVARPRPRHVSRS